MKIPYRILKARKLEALLQRNAFQEDLIKRSISFIREIEAGNMEVQLSVSQDHELSKAMLSMQEHLSFIAKQEKEKKWATEGFAQFIDIIRKSNDNLQKLSERIIQYLVKYLEANQGALFLIADDEHESFLEMMACYAYDRKKHLTKRIEIGEGLVGQCFLEKETIYMTNVPESYATITSGLGEATPRSVLLIPLKNNDTVMGIMEFASFKVFPAIHIEFLERLGETIASQISMSRINDRTSKLMEEYRIQAEELKAQEEEMKQNMEELMATQETQSRLEKELKLRLDELELAKMEMENMKRTESERTKKQNEVQAKIMNSTIEKYKRKESELLKKLQEKELELEQLRKNYTPLDLNN